MRRSKQTNKQQSNRMSLHPTYTASLPHSLLLDSKATRDDDMSAGRKRRVECAVVSEKDQDHKEYSEREYQDHSYTWALEKLSVCTHDNEEVRVLCYHCHLRFLLRLFACMMSTKLQVLIVCTTTIDARSALFQTTWA